MTMPITTVPVAPRAALGPFASRRERGARRAARSDSGSLA
jgi:hypothetical protein